MNIYQEGLGWVAEYRGLDGRWVRLGVFGTYTAAVTAAWQRVRL